TKLIDFGLARIAVASVAEETQPTCTEITTEGAVVGTVAYMSPEQARGLPVDRRADIWAFGCVLYKCLTGRALFTGATSNDVIAAILGSVPSLDDLPQNAPARIHQLLTRCVQPDLNHRLRTIAVAVIELEDALAAPPPPPVRKPAGAFWIAAGTIFAAL